MSLIVSPVKWINENIGWIIYGLVQVLVIPVVLHWRFLLNLKVSAKKVIEGKILSIGAIRREGNVLSVRFLWTSRKLRVDNAVAILGYTNDYDGMETLSTESVEIKFKGGISLVFDSKKVVDESHQKILNDFAKVIGIGQRDSWWSEAFDGVEEDPVVFYKKEEKEIKRNDTVLRR